MFSRRHLSHSVVAPPFLSSTAPSSNTAEDQRIADARNHVHGLHSKLRGCVDNLSDKISGVMQKQEKEFLSAYRAHM